MKIEELRIGNFVDYFNQDLMIDIEDFNDIYEDKEELNNYNPILLTEKWLLKFGFKIKTIEFRDKSVGKYYSYKNFRTPADKFNNDYYPFSRMYYGEYQFLGNIKYVHELQNLFYALEKKELIYNNKN